MSMTRRVMTCAALPRNSRAKVTVPQPSGSAAGVSVIVPCYNYGQYLWNCVQSALGQEGVNVEVLIIDDASTDDSPIIARELAGSDGRVRTIRHSTNLGHIATYNEGIAAVRSDYTVLLSADDLLTPGCLSRATALMERHPTVGMTYGFALDFSGSCMPPARTTASSWITWSGASWIACRCATGRNILRSPEAVMRTSILRRVGGYRPDLPHAGDFELWLRAATVSDVGFVSGADQAYYRVHSNNMHLSRFNLVSDLKQRLESFEILFRERGHLIRDSESMRHSAHRALAREAIRHAMDAYILGPVDEYTIDQLRKFALTAWPEVSTLREWRALSRFSQNGIMSRWRPAAASHRAARKTTDVVRWRRRRLAGV
jgi:glycosyltransferase involved in cell wall biosynthesis